MLLLLFFQRPDQLLSAAHLSSLPVFRAAPHTSQLGQPLSTQKPEPAEQVTPFWCLLTTSFLSELRRNVTAIMHKLTMTLYSKWYGFCTRDASVTVSLNSYSSGTLWPSSNECCQDYSAAVSLFVQCTECRARQGICSSCGCFFPTRKRVSIK